MLADVHICMQLEPSGGPCAGFRSVAHWAAQKEAMATSEHGLYALVAHVAAGWFGIMCIRGARRGGEAVARRNERIMGSGVEHSDANFFTSMYFVVGVLVCSVVLYSIVTNFAIPWVRRLG